MRDFTKVSPLVWRSKKFKALTAEDRLLYLYLLTNSHSNSVGCYVIPLDYVAFDLGRTPEDVLKGIERVSETLLIGFDKDEDLVLLHNFLTFNGPMNPNHAKMMKKEANSLPDSSLKFVLLKELNSILNEKGWGNPSETLSIPFANPLPTLSHKTRPDQTILNQTRGSVSGDSVGGFSVKALLSPDALAKAKRNGPGWDMNHLMKVYDTDINTGNRQMPSSINLAFPAWVAKYTKGKPPA